MNKLEAEHYIKQLVGGQNTAVRQVGDKVKIEWEDSPLKFAHLADISEKFGTLAIDIGQEDFSIGYVNKLTIHGVELDE